MTFKSVARTKVDSLVLQAWVSKAMLLRLATMKGDGEPPPGTVV